MYYVVYGCFYVLSLLPLWFLHGLSDIVTSLNWYVVGYRKKIVLENLAIAFPEKTEAERKRIARRFYRNFIDTFIETIKCVSASEKFILKHFTADVRDLRALYSQGKSCQVHMGHNFNWELANIGMPLSSPYQMLTVYMPISNKVLNRLFLKIRSKTGAIMLPATKMSTALRPYLDRQYLLTLVADQNPGIASRGYWINFFGRPTPFVKGPEKSARFTKAAVLFGSITQTRRGHYHASIDLAVPDASVLPEGELTVLYIRFLEKVIRDHPEMWLWSHRRWKHQWKHEYGIIGETPNLQD